METEDPVLQRDLFRSREKDVKQAGIASVAEKGDEGYNSRVEEAKRLFEQARIKQDPSRFQTLSEQEKPGVFRPIQAGATQMPQPNVQQQMAQMQAMGFRPVGMAGGGYVRGYAPGGEVRPTVSLPYNFDMPSAWKDIVQYNNPDDPSTWTQDYIAATVEKLSKENPDVPADRFLQSILKDVEYAKKDAGKTESSIIRPSKDTGEFSDVSGDMDYRQRMREQEDAGIAALPDKRDYAGDREYARNVSEDASRREEARPDKRDFESERPYNQATAEREAGLASLAPTASDDATANAINARLKSGIKGVNASATGTRTGSATSSAATSGIAGTQQAAEDVPEKQTTTLEGIKAERAKERAENINLAIIQAGLGMAAGTSSNALTNIGQGGISGLKAFSEAETESRRAMREAERSAREEERANRAFEEQRRQFGMTFGEAGRRFDIESARADRQIGIAENQFEKTFGLSMQKAKQDENQFERTFGLSVQAAEQKAKEFAADQDYKTQSLANDKEKLNLARDQLKAETEQAIATRDSKKLESSSSLASQILNATNARIAALRASQKQNAMMGITDPSVEAEIEELRRQAQEAKQNYYAVQESLGIRLPGAEVDPLGIRR